MPLDQQDDDLKYIIPPAGSADSHLPDLMDFAKRNNLQIGSMVTGTHNRGSKHYSGNAFDIKDSGKYTDEQVAALSEVARLSGYKLRDERVRPAGQSIWDGPHIHIEYVGAPDEDAKYFSVVEPTRSLAPTATVSGLRPPPREAVTSNVYDDTGQPLPTSAITKVPRLNEGAPASQPAVGMRITVPIHPDDTAQDIYESAYSRALLSLGLHANDAEKLGMEMARAQAAKTGGQLFRAGTNTPLTADELSALKASGATLFSFDDPEFIAQLREAAFNAKPALQQAVESALTRSGNPIEKFLGGAAVKAGAGLSEAVGGGLRIGLTGNLIGQMAGLRDPFASTEQAIERQAQAARAGVSEASQYSAPVETAQNLTAGAIESAPLVLATGGTGIIPAAAGFGTYGALQAAGQGQPLPDVAKEGAKQAIIGGMLGAEGVDIPSSVKVGGTVLGTFGTEKAFGASTPQALQSAATTGLLRTIGEVKEYVHAQFGKVTEAENQSGVPRGRIRVTDEQGDTHVIIKPSTVRNQRAVPVPPDSSVRPQSPGMESRVSQPSSPVPELAAPPAAPLPIGQQIADANATITRIENSIAQTRLVKNPTGRTLALRTDLMGKLSDAVKQRNLSLDPKLQAALEGRSKASVFAERRGLGLLGRADHPIADAIINEQTVPEDVLDPPVAAKVRAIINEARTIAETSGVTTSGSVTESPEVVGRNQGGEGVGAAEATAEGLKPPPTTGIAQRVEEARRGESAPTGEGISGADSVARGRQLLQGGADPQGAVEKFKTDGAISSDAMALVRARHEELARAANKAFDEHGIDSNEFKAAEQARSDWWENAVKPMQTEWHKTGMAQQGETAIDTGTFYGLYRAVKDATGQEMSPQQTQQAKGIVARVSSADSKVADVTRMLTDELNRATGLTDLHPDVQTAIKRFVDESAREARSQQRQQTSKTLDDEAAVIKSNIAAEFARLKSKRQSGTANPPSGLAGLDPEGVITKQIIKLAKNRVKAGITDAAQLIDDIHAAISEFADITKRQVAEVVAGMGNVPGINKRPPSDWMGVKSDVRDVLAAQDAAQNLANLKERLAGGGAITPADAQTVWQYARDNYVDKGVDINEAFQSTARDLGVTPDDVRQAVASQPKAKRLTNELYQRMSARRQARQAAESWVNNQGKSLGLKAVENTANAFFNIKTFGHGTVGPVTHAGENIFHPSRWVDYFTNVGRTWKAAYSTAAHERYVQDLVNDPNYLTARRAGLANEPGKFYDEYQNALASKMFGAVGKIGNRGFDVLKVMRQDFFNSRWNGLDESQRTPEMAQAIADLVNHSTGAVRTKLPEPYGSLSRGILFAAPLEASRWARILGDPIKAADTYINWKNATPSDKYFAKSVAIGHAEFAATYLAALALNQGVLSATGSKDSVNFSDPSKGDWLRLKVKGRAIEPTGGIIATLDFLGKLGQAALGAQDPREGRFERMGKASAQYGRGKLSPIASTATDVVTQGDFRGRPMPFSSDKERAGKPRYSWAEYFLTQQSPIPAAEGLHDFFTTMRAQGVPVSTMDQIFNAAMERKAAIAKGAAIGTLSGSTGVRIGEEYTPRTPGLKQPPVKK